MILIIGNIRGPHPILIFILGVCRDVSLMLFGIKLGISFLDCLPVVVDKQGVVVDNRMVDSVLRVEHKLWQLRSLTP